MQWFSKYFLFLFTDNFFVLPPTTFSFMLDSASEVWRATVTVMRLRRLAEPLSFVDSDEPLISF